MERMTTMKAACLTLTLAVLTFALILVARVRPEMPDRVYISAPLVSAFAPVTDDTVTVEHQIIPLDALTETERPSLADSPSRLVRADLTPAFKPRTSPPAQRGLVSRAKRAFLGDGRHRPEPFPRVKEN